MPNSTIKTMIGNFLPKVQKMKGLCSFFNCKLDVVVLPVNYFQKFIAIIIIIKNTKYSLLYLKYSIDKQMHLTEKIFSSKCPETNFRFAVPKRRLLIPRLFVGTGDFYTGWPT